MDNSSGGSTTQKARELGNVAPANEFTGEEERLETSSVSSRQRSNRTVEWVDLEEASARHRLRTAWADGSEVEGGSRPSTNEIRNLERGREVSARRRSPRFEFSNETSETDNAIATAEALTEIIEERLRLIRNPDSPSKVDKGLQNRLNELKASRPLSGLRVVSRDSSRPSSVTSARRLRTEDRPRSSRPASGTRLTARPQSNCSSLRPNSAIGLSGRPLSSRELRLNAQNKTKPANALANYLNSQTLNGSDRPEVILHTGPRPSFSSLFEVSDTLTRIRKWSQAKYRNRRGESRGSSDSKKRKKSSDSKRSRQSHRRLDMSEKGEDELRDELSEQRRKTRTFAWYSRVIKAVVKLCLDMQKLSMQKTEQTPISEMYYINIAGPSVGEDPTQQLFFDKSWFSRKRATSRVPLWAQAMTIKPPKDRPEEDIVRLHTLLLNMRSFKEKFTEDMRLKMCKVMRYTQCDKGRVILRQGHYGQDFYFIYSGSVFIQIDIEDKATGNVTTHTENIIRNGESFGEIALMGDGERSACVICREPTELFQIDKNTFMDICPGIFRIELDEKMEFAKKFPIFKDWDADSFESLCFNSQVLYKPHGRTFEDDWSKANYVYFVMKGRISLRKEFDVMDMLDLTAQGMMDKELLYRKPENEDAMARKKQACIGSLGENEFSDLRLLSMEPPASIGSISMVSEGVKVLRVAVRTFNRLCPRKLVEDYLKKDFEPIDIPTNAQICDKVFKDSIWTSYKKSVLNTVGLEQSGFAIAHLPSTVKGTSGWARWPGFDDEAELKTGRLTSKKNRSYVDPFLIVKTPNRKTKPSAPEVQVKPPERHREDKSQRVDIIVETEEEHGILPIVRNNDRSLICKPRGITNEMELRKSVTRFNRRDDNTPRQRNSSSGASGKSVFITEPVKE